MKIILFFIVLIYPYGAMSTSHHTITWEKGVYKKTVSKWVTALYNVADVGSTTYITKKVGGEDSLHVTGHRDSIIWIPNTTDLTKKLKIVVWFHGHRGYVGSRTFEDRTLKQFIPLAKERENFVIIIPEMPWSVHTKTPTKRNGNLWKKEGAFINFINQTKAVLKAHGHGQLSEQIDYRVVGHSAGGSTIKRLAMTGDICRINVSMIVWSDSSYGRWLDDAWDGCLSRSGNINIKIFVRKWGPTWKQLIRFLGTFQDLPENIEFNIMEKPWTHKKIGNNIVHLSNLLKETKT